MTVLSIFEPSGNMVVVDCKNLAVIQLQSQPWLNEIENFVYHRKAVVISGSMFSVEATASRPGMNISLVNKETKIQFRTYTDIWLPRVYAMNDPASDGDLLFDNKELSDLNGTRLNQAINQLQDLTKSIGGVWRVAEDFENKPSDFSISGIALK